MFGKTLHYTYCVCVNSLNCSFTKINSFLFFSDFEANDKTTKGAANKISIKLKLLEKLPAIYNQKCEKFPVYFQNTFRKIHFEKMHREKVNLLTQSYLFIT